MYWILIILGLSVTPQSEVNTGIKQNYPEVFVKVRVWGLVRTPGIYYLPPSSNVLDAISSAGGPKSGANLSNIKLIRANRGEILYINVGKYINGKNVDIPYVQSGDMIYVQQSFLDKFIGAVRTLAIFTGSIGLIYQIIYTKTKG